MQLKVLVNQLFPDQPQGGQRIFSSRLSEQFAEPLSDGINISPFPLIAQAPIRIGGLDTFIDDALKLTPIVASVGRTHSSLNLKPSAHAFDHLQGRRLLLISESM
jgi:hypothetical protein